MTVLNCKNLTKDISLVGAGVLLILLAFFIFSSNQAFSAENEQNIGPAMGELSQVYGQSITSKEEAHEVCNQEKFFTACAEIGKKYSLYKQEEVEQIDAFLNEIKGTIAQNLQNCQTVECLVNVASDLAAKVSSTNPTLAQNLDLTSKIVQEKQTIVQTAKDYGVSFDQCRDMDPESAPVELLRICARLARDSRVQQFVSDQFKRVAEFSDKAVNLRESLTKGEYKCGDGTLNSCGDFCLNPSEAAKAAGIPQVCRDIAKRFFGADGEKQLESSYQQVRQVRDFYDKKAQNIVFTTLDGKILTKPEDIGGYMEQEGKKGNVEAVEKGMDFMVAQGFVKPEEKDFALKFVRQIRDRGGIPDFDGCAQNPLACRDFLPEEDRQSFDTHSQIEQIMTREIGFKPFECERGSVDETIGQRCYEGSKRALPQLEALAASNPQARFIVEDIKRHINQGEQQINRKDEFRQVFQQQGGPGGCRSEGECYSYCSDPSHGPECIAFGSRQNISGFQGQEAVQRFQKFNQTLQTPQQFQPTSVFPRPDQFPGGQFPGQGPYPGFRPPGFDGYPSGQVPGFTQPGPGFGPVGPSPECFAAIQSGDFVRAKAVCTVSIPAGIPPVPLWTPIGPPITIPVCPPDNYWNGQNCVSYNTLNPEVQCRNAGGVFDPATSSCRIGEYSPPPYQSYTPGPYPTYSPGIYPTYTPYPGGGWEGQYPGQCSDGLDNDGDGTIDSADTSCTTPPFTSGGSCPSGSHIMYVNNAGGYCMSDADTSKCGPLNSTSVSGFGSCAGFQTTPTYSPGPGGKPQCSDGIDNDNDGQIDYPADLSCYGLDDWDEYYPKPGDITYTPAPSCPAGQWWDYTYNQCTSAPACGAGYYWDSGTNKCKPSGTTCSQSLINLLGSGCHQMYSDSLGRSIFCDGPMTKSAKEGDTATKAGCNPEGGPTYSPPPSPPPGGTTQCSDGLDNDGDAFIDYPSDTGCYGRDDNDEAYYPPPSSQCPPGAHSMGSYCMSDADTSKCGPLNSTSVSGFGSCAGFQTTPTYSPGPGVSYTPPPSCPSGQWWDYATNSCKTTTTATFTPYPTCPSGQYWDSATSSCKTSSYTPPPSCPSDQYWNGTSCVSSGTTYTPYPTTAYTPYPTTEYTPYPTIQYTPPPSTYQPPPTYEAPPPTTSPPPTSSLQHQLAVANTIMACADKGGKWNASSGSCRPTIKSYFGNIFRLFFR